VWIDKNGHPPNVTRAQMHAAVIQMIERGEMKFYHDLPVDHPEMSLRLGLTPLGERRYEVAS
jgi:hypothetical protein